MGRTDGTDTDESSDEREYSEQSPESSTGAETPRERARPDGIGVFSEDVFRNSPDRQVLVVGDGVVGRTLTGLLQRRGYEPVLATGLERTVEPTISYLRPDALAVLEHVDVARRVREYGTPIESVSVGCPAGGAAGSRRAFPLSEAESSDEARPVLVDTTTLRRLLDVEGDIQRAASGRTVTAISRTDDGLAVEFRDGVRERFDVVVDTAGAGICQESSEPGFETAAVRQCVARVESRERDANRLQDVWFPDALVERVPTPEPAETLLRVTAPIDGACSVLESDGFGKRVPGDADAVTTALHSTESTLVRQRTLDGTVDTRRRVWAHERVARCGVGASPIAPASGCRLSFGLEDAAAFVTELGRGQRPLDDALHAYASGRKQEYDAARLKRTAASTIQPYPEQAPMDPTLHALGVFRAVALEPFLKTSPSDH